MLVVALVSLSRLLDGYFTSALSLEICAAFDAPRRESSVAPDKALAKRKEHVLRLVGLAGSIGTLSGAMLSSLMADGAADEGGGSENATAVT